jgi:hypothetical protein
MPENNNQNEDVRIKMIHRIIDYIEIKKYQKETKDIWLLNAEMLESFLCDLENEIEHDRKQISGSTT